MEGNSGLVLAERARAKADFQSSLQSGTAAGAANEPDPLRETSSSSRLPPPAPPPPPRVSLSYYFFNISPYGFSWQILEERDEAAARFRSHSARSPRTKWIRTRKEETSAAVKGRRRHNLQINLQKKDGSSFSFSTVLKIIK